MRNVIIGTFIAIFALGISQPLLEVFNVLTEKVELGAALMNSCRAARNHALEENYYEAMNIGGLAMNIGDLDAFIDEDRFRYFFAKAFAATLDVSIIDDSSDPVIFGANGRWNSIRVYIDWEDDIDTNELEGRTVSMATVELVTPYRFKTGLLQRLIAGDNVSHGYYITETRPFMVQIIN